MFIDLGVTAVENQLRCQPSNQGFSESYLDSGKTCQLH